MMLMTYDVVVAGAGPVGLMVAGELALRGVRVLVIERLAEPDQTVKAGAINVPTAEALERRGLLPELRAVQAAVLERMGFAGKQGLRLAGHFGGIWLSADDLDPSFADDRGPAAWVAMISQAEIERILAEHATA